MKILALECSASPCSAAILEDGKIISSAFVNVKITHSQTLMMLVEGVLKSSLTGIDDIGGVAVGIGPGSFTGIRIGISAVKGLASPEKLPCVGVSTLEAIAENLSDKNALICAVMDAKCNQVYNAVFNAENGEIARICEDRAISIENLKKELNSLSQKYEKSVIIAGDGSDVFYPAVLEDKNIIKADEKHIYQNAVGVAFCAAKCFIKNETVLPEALNPVYLRLPQAERELKLRKEQEK